MTGVDVGPAEGGPEQPRLGQGEAQVADAQGAEPAQWSLYRAPAPARTFDPRFSRLAQELDEASDRRSASLAVHTSLSAVADRILFDRYDVDRARDPDAAREILGEQAWTYLDTTPRNEKMVFSPQLFDVLDRLESL